MTTNAQPLVTRLNDADPLAVQMAEDVQALQEATVDAMSTTQALTVVPQHLDVEDVNDNVLVMARTPTGDVPLRVLDGAHRQVADKVGIPWPYYQRMLEVQPDLLAVNINNWFNSDPQNRLVRMLGPITDEDREHNTKTGAHAAVRAFLSDSYRPIDHGALLNVLLQEAQKVGARVAEYDLSARHFHVRLIGEERRVEDIIADVLRRNPDHPPHACTLQEVISRGVAIRNSETGHGAFSMAEAIRILRCINTMEGERMRIAHLGGKQNGDRTEWREDTRRLDDAATFLKVRDKFAHMFSAESEEKIVRQLTDAAGTPLALPEKVPVMEFIDRVGKKYEMAEHEMAILRDEFVKETAVTGVTEPTRWTLGQAFTATARRLHAEEGKTFERKAEVEHVGWQVLGDPLTQLLAK
jgi:hypothetical protein